MATRGSARWLLVGLMLGMGCAATKLVDVWVDPAYTRGPLRKVLVASFWQDDRGRRILEDRIVAELRKAGAEAVPSYSLMPDVTPEERESISKAIEGKGFDGVLITHYAGTEEESVYVPGRTRTEVYGSGHPWSRIDSHYWRAVETVSMPGYYDKQTTVYLETNVYETGDARLIWSARSKTLNPASTLDLIDDLSKQLVASLSHGGLL